MTNHLKSPLARPLIAFALAASWTLASFGVVTAPVSAANNANYYKAELQQPLENSRKGSIGGTYWNCKGTTCTGVKSGSSAIRVCQRLVKRHGAVKSFSHKGKALTEQQLVKCNAA